MPLSSTCSASPSGNSAGSSGGAINNQSVDPTYTNCLVWNNEANGSTGSLSASVNNGQQASPVYSHCLVQNYPLGGTNPIEMQVRLDAGSNITVTYGAPGVPSSYCTATGSVRR